MSRVPPPRPNIVQLETLELVGPDEARALLEAAQIMASNGDRVVDVVLRVRVGPK